ncbi:hypothetical protein VKT23_006250 [Stygiomarasmius scandens]|uniref:Uncharacterized protein n=1 Tax=Marasmiellus scandens TaxID=2682957 RepID=A0ABR1JMX0_9AGAR
MANTHNISDKPLPPLELEEALPSSEENNPQSDTPSQLVDSSVSQSNPSSSSDPSKYTSMSSLLNSLSSSLSSPSIDNVSSTMSSLWGSVSSSIRPIAAPAATSAMSMANGVWSWAENHAYVDNSQRAASVKQMEDTILGLLRVLVNQQHSDLEPVKKIIESCDEACRRQSLSFSELLQRKSIEGHTPMYWVIVAHRPSSEDADGKKRTLDVTVDFIKLLFAPAAPLTSSTISDILQACLVLGSQDFFQRVRNLPEFTSLYLSGADLLLLGSKAPLDDIQVQNMDLKAEGGEVPGFEVKFRIPQFQKRMMVSQSVQMEFIAKGRMWRARFFVITESDQLGSWALGIQTLEQSAPAYVDATLTISEANASPSRDASASDSAISTKLKVNSLRQLVSINRVEVNEAQTQSVYGVVDDNTSDSSLHQSGSKYIARDDTLAGKLEIRLTRPPS